MVGWLKPILIALAIMAGLWVLSPIDLLPEFLASGWAEARSDEPGTS